MVGTKKSKNEILKSSRSRLPWIRKLEVLVEVVEAVEKVPELAAEEGEDVAVAEL